MKTTDLVRYAYSFWMDKALLVMRVRVASHYLDFFSVSVFKVLLDDGVHRLLQHLLVQLRHHRGVHCVTLCRDTDKHALQFQLDLQFSYMHFSHLVEITVCVY